MELADTSAWTTRHRSHEARAAFDSLVARGQIATCEPVVFELLRSERDSAAMDARRDDLAGLPSVGIQERTWRRALDVLTQIADHRSSTHRSFPLADLLVAAAAELSELPVVHYDRHFELIAEVTGQPVRALAPLGSL
jgi:predicted nucleic acid-binding protein